MKVKKYATSVLLAGLFAPMLTSVSAALAAAPSNDTIAGATQVLGLPFSDVVDTTEATTDSDDTQLNSTGCGYPATDASVWYVLNGSDTRVFIDASQSNYFATVLVGVGSPGNLQAIWCAGERAEFFAAAGTTYYVLVIDPQYDGGGNGGTLNISFSEIPPLTVDISINPIGQVNTRTGVATISGSYTCAGTNGFGFFDVGFQISQSVGRFTIYGSIPAFPSFTCDGTSRSWSADVFPFGANKFSGGKMMTSLDASACDFIFGCVNQSVQQTVQLRGGGK